MKRRTVLFLPVDGRALYEGFSFFQMNQPQGPGQQQPPGMSAGTVQGSAPSLVGPNQVVPGQITAQRNPNPGMGVVLPGQQQQPTQMGSMVTSQQQIGRAIVGTTNAGQPNAPGNLVGAGNMEMPRVTFPLPRNISLIIYNKIADCNHKKGVKKREEG